MSAAVYHIIVSHYLLLFSLHLLPIFTLYPISLRQRFLSLTSSVEDARLESESIDRDKGGLIMSKVKQLRIHTIPGIYNRLSASATSQTLVVTQLLEKIVAASKERIPELLRYTLCKVAAQLVSQAQSEFFIIEDEAQSLPVS
jgi:hypothetical protein